MGKIQHIKKSRKEHRCGKCRTSIPAGSSYFKGTINFHPDIIRCEKCGLKWYEVTTSEYIREVGSIKEDWQESFELCDGVWEEIASNLEQIMDSCNERLENMPEQLQEESETGQLLQERIDSLESAIDDLGNCSMDDFLQEGYEELTEEEQSQLEQAGDISDMESWYQDFWKKDSELARKWKEKVEDAITSCIETILEEIPCD